MYRYAARRGFASVLLTLVMGYAIAVLKGGLTPADTLLILLVAALQILLTISNALSAAAVPIERLTSENRLPSAQGTRRLALGLGLTPLSLLLRSEERRVGK